jgi:predicted Zn-dependent protease
MFEDKLVLLLGCTVLSLLISCSTTPTGRKQLTLLPASQIDGLGDQSFEELKKKAPLSTDPKENGLTVCITERLLQAMGENPKEWEIKVFKDDSPNAFALPGRNVGVHTGMIKLVENLDQLAAVIGHEIGHVLAQHGNERVSQSLAAQAGMGVAQLALGNNTQQDQMILAALGIGAQVGVLLPFSRGQETEADRLGLQYMAEAGFDPRQAAKLWDLMSKQGGGSPPQFLSTHPSHESRIKDLSALAPSHMAAYNSVTYKPKCMN